MKTHELGDKVSRRGALGLVGGFAALAIGAAPSMHEQSILDVDMDIVDYGYAEPAPERLKNDATAPDVNRVDVELTNHGTALIPIFFTWDQRRKGRHRWEIRSGPVPLGAGDDARYRIASLGAEGRMNAGSITQLTVFEKGTQRWQSIKFVTDKSGESQ